MPLLEIYKDYENSASAVPAADSRAWTPQATVNDMTMKMKLTMPHINETFPTREEAEQAGLLVGKKWIDDSKPAP